MGWRWITRRNFFSTSVVVAFAASVSTAGVVLSFSDSDLGAFAAGWHRAAGGLPALRLCNLAALRHPVSVDQYGEATLSGARAVLVRLIGGEASQVKLEKEFSARQKDGAAQDTAFKSAVTKFQTDAPVLAETKRQEQQKKLMEQERDLQRTQRSFQEDLNKRKNEELQQVLERANRVVKQVAEAEKYDVILQEAVYINPKHDITDKVIKALNASK